MLKIKLTDTFVMFLLLANGESYVFEEVIEQLTFSTTLATTTLVILCRLGR